MPAQEIRFEAGQRRVSGKVRGAKFGSRCPCNPAGPPQLKFQMIVFPCHVCRTDLSAEDAQSGQLVRCPSCLTTLRVPAPAVAGGYQPAPAMASAYAGAGVGAAPGGYAPPRPYSAPAIG